MASIGFGTYRLGQETRRACADALELGYRHIDTASLYGNEAAVGEAVRASGIARSEITVTSKVWVDEIASGRITEAVARSVERVGQIDVMLLHAPVGNAAEIAVAWEALLAGCEAHGVERAGVSNFGLVHLAALDPLPAVNQIEMSPFWTRRELVDHCHSAGIDITAHSPLAKARRLDHQVLAEIAAEIELAGRSATPAQVMLAWAVGRGAAPLPRTRSPERLAENLAASTITLQPSQRERLAALDDGFATHPQHR